MKIKDVSGVILLVEDLDESTSFYELLGFEFKERVPDVATKAHLNQFWVELLRKDKVITEAFFEDGEVSPKGAGQYLHINVEEVDEFYEAIIARGLKPLSQPMDFPWGHREFVVRDPDGYKLVFFTEV